MSVLEEHRISELSQIVSEQLLPRAAAGDGSRLLLAQPKLQAPPEVAVRYRTAPPLKAESRQQSRIYLSRWKQESMHAVRYPYLCCVLDGEADMRLAFPAARGQAPGKSHDYQIITLHPQTFLMIPPGVLYPDGTQAHWERQPQPVADSHLFWILFLPTGVFCHTCSTQQTRHTCQGDIFVPDLQLPVLVEMLIEELRSTQPDANLATQNILMLILLRVRRGLAQLVTSQNKQITGGTRRSLTPLSSASEVAAATCNTLMPANSAIVERVCTYIRTHLNQPFSIKDIAESLYVSPSHLARLFQQEMGVSVMRYARQKRLETALSMLANTELAVQEISRLSGYDHVPQFNRMFKQSHGMTPTDFRNRHRQEEKMSINVNK